MSFSEPVSGGGTSGDDGSADDSTSGDDSGGGGGGGSGGSLWSEVEVLTAFVNNPRGFVLGAVLTTVLETVTGVVTTVFDQLVLLAGGSQPTEFNVPGEQRGLADIPVAVADTLIGAGGFSGDVIIAGVVAFNEQIADAAAVVGPFGPFVLIVLISAETILTAVILRRIVFLVADWLQLGGLTE